MDDMKDFLDSLVSAQTRKSCRYGLKIRDYDMLLLDRGTIIFESREAKVVSLDHMERDRR